MSADSRRSTTYKYAFLNYQPSLTDRTDSDLVLAVVVETKQAVLIMGKTPILPDGASEIAQEIIHNLRQTLTTELSSWAEHPTQSVFEYLGVKYRWNIYLTKAASKNSNDEIGAFAMGLLDEKTGFPVSRKTGVKQLALPIQENSPLVESLFRLTQSPVKMMAHA